MDCARRRHDLTSGTPWRAGIDAEATDAATEPGASAPHTRTGKRMSRRLRVLRILGRVLAALGRFVIDPCLAVGAQALEFDFLATQAVTRLFDLRDQRLAQLRLVQLFDTPTVLADHE